jgi:hypothetical protein
VVASSQGFFSRITNSLAGLIIGPLLIIGAIVLLWWNEGRAVQAIVGLKDAARHSFLLLKFGFESINLRTG